MTDSKTRWEVFEDWLYDQHTKNGMTQFTQESYRKDTGRTSAEASGDIQAYLAAQRKRPQKKKLEDGTMINVGGSETLFVLHREPGTRTSVAVWLIEVRTADARLIGKSFGDDVRRRARRAFRPDLLRIAERNKRAAKQVEAQIEATLDHAIAILDLAAQGVMPSGEDEDES